MQNKLVAFAIQLAFHLLSCFEQRVILLARLTEAGKQAIARSKVLAIVARKVKMVQGMVRRAINNALKACISDHVRVMDHDAP